MSFEIKGNYFNGEFQQEAKGSSKEVSRYCPADTERLLWKFNISYEQVDDIIESATHGHNYWKYGYFFSIH